MGRGQGERGGFGGGEPSFGAWTTSATNHQRQHHPRPQVPHRLSQDLCQSCAGLCASSWRCSGNPSQVLPRVPNSHQSYPWKALQK
ncbi:hypothetical protein L3X38_018760 [Prunus dulcis]|uniref:Uncharacterized protein n=1 Tax=Prunus dulcis TaxID=3755 RepID=A0AAD4YNC6_PRUDU|nr:hypothetical protein L3X38_036199 [Prunus dulcis]KAI5339488.1 hypothetical protein L3X38_018760 [Prunus dulcis]